MFNIYMECEETVDGFQAQPTCTRGWRLLKWANDTLKSMEDGANEASWDLTAAIPAGFEAWSSNPDNVNLFFYLRVYIFIIFFSDKHFNNFEVFIFSDGL